MKSVCIYNLRKFRKKRKAHQLKWCMHNKETKITDNLHGKSHGRFLNWFGHCMTITTSYLQTQKKLRIMITIIMIMCYSDHQLHHANQHDPLVIPSFGLDLTNNLSTKYIAFTSSLYIFF